MNDSIAAKPTDGPADSTAAGTDPALTATAKLTPREKKWIIYDVGNSTTWATPRSCCCPPR